MRVLMTTDTVGGVWTFTQEMAAGLLAGGHSVLLVSFGRVPSEAQLEQCDQLALRFPEEFLYVTSDTPLEWMDANQSVFEEGSMVLEREAEEFAPDLIYSNQFCYGAIDLPIPRVVTAHSDVLSWAKACRGGLLEQSSWLDRYVSMVQAGLAQSDAVVAPTAWMLDMLTESFRVSAETAVIANGRSIDASFEAKRDLRAVTAGRLWDEAKSIATLDEVDSPVPVLVAGDTMGDRQETIPPLGSARLIGRLSEPEMLDLLQHSAIYLCLSRYEPFGLAPLEAGLCGCAVVARNIPSLHEVWEDAALFFDDADELSVLLRKLKDDPNFLERARASSFRRARRFTRERMVQQYLVLFRRVLARYEREQHAA